MVVAMTEGIIEVLRGCLKRGVAVRDRVVEGAQLGGVELTGLRADRLTLRGVDLRMATLDETEWINCRIVDVRMGRTTARKAIFRMCTLDNVRAAECDMWGLKLENSQAQGAVFEGATLAVGSFVDSDLTRAVLRGANLRDVDASGTILRGADLREADLHGASLVDADLRGADLRSAAIARADLDGADLRGALIDEAAERDPTTGGAAGVAGVRGAAASRGGPNSQVADGRVGGTDNHDHGQRGAQYGAPPPVAKLANAVGPLVVDILRRGNQRGVLDDDRLASVVADIEKLGVDPTPPLPKLDGPLRQILQQVSTIGIAPLLASLQQRGDTPPPEVAKLIESLTQQSRLGPDATAEDLVVHMLGQLGVSSAP